MLQISQLKLSLDASDEDVRKASASVLGLRPDELISFEIRQRAIDARGGGVEFSFMVWVEVESENFFINRRFKQVQVCVAPNKDYVALNALPETLPERSRPVVIGMGPCGLFAALLFARKGLKPIILERGKQAGPRARDVTGFWRRGLEFDPESNVQFGEGGAGTFSDGKLYTQIKDRENRIPWLLKELVKAGAPEDILIKSRPHIGTDRLITVLRKLREEILELGGEIRFETRVDDVRIEDGSLSSVQTSDGDWIESDHFVLAVGHSARDTFEMLHKRGVPFEAKSFSLGVRIEHPQSLIDRIQFGKKAGHPRLGASPYKFAWHSKNGRGVYSFCMCPGGLVVAAASEAGGVVTNGMSSYARAEANANSGFMVEITPEDVGGSSPLAGIEFQREWERKAFEVGGSNYHAPAQLLGDFMKGKASKGPGSVKPSYEPGVVWTDLRECLPTVVAKMLKQSVHGIDKRLHGFLMDEAVLTGVESRSSSPVRIVRDRDTLECLGLKGLYPAGEGAGYAGGIISAAADGMKVAEAILKVAPEGA